MTLATLRIEFRGICCFFEGGLPEAKKTVVLLDASQNKKIKYRDVAGAEQEKCVEPHIAYVAVDQQTHLSLVRPDGSVQDPHEIVKGVKLFGYLLGPGDVITYRIVPDNYINVLDESPSLLTKLFSNFALNPALLRPHHSATAAMVPIFAGELTDETDSNDKTITSMLGVKVAANSDGRIELTRKRINGKEEKLLLDPAATLIVGNEMEHHIAGGTTADLHHLLLYSLFSTTTVKLRIAIVKKHILGLLKSFRLCEAIHHLKAFKRAAGLGCSNSQYP